MIMKQQVPETDPQVQITPFYAVHTVPQDDVVIFYNRKKPLIIEGKQYVKLFQWILKFDGPIPIFEISNLSKDLVALIPQLIDQNLLELSAPCQ